MGSIQNDKVKTAKIQDKKVKKLPPSLSLEERLKVIANLIVDRISEDQTNGNLRSKVQGIK